MDGIKKFLVVIFLAGMSSLSWGQLVLPTVYTTFITPRIAQVTSQNTFYYQRSNRTGISIYPEGSPAVTIGGPPAMYTLNLKSPGMVEGNVIHNFSSYLGAFSSPGAQSVTVDFSNTNCLLVSLNITVANVVVTINVSLGTAITYDTGALARHLKIYIKYGGTNAPSRLAIAPPSGYKLLWPSGDSPIFTKALGKMDIVSLFWTGPGWPLNNNAAQKGEFYGTVSLNHTY